MFNWLEYILCWDRWKVSCLLYGHWYQNCLSGWRMEGGYSPQKVNKVQCAECGWPEWKDRMRKRDRMVGDWR